jgi:hypothetical protein
MPVKKFERKIFFKVFYLKSFQSNLLSLTEPMNFKLFISNFFWKTIILQKLFFSKICFEFSVKISDLEIFPRNEFLKSIYNTKNMSIFSYVYVIIYPFSNFPFKSWYDAENLPVFVQKSSVVSNTDIEKFAVGDDTKYVKKSSAGKYQSINILL